MNNKIRTPLLLSSITLALMLAGCGSEDTPTPIEDKPAPIVILPGEADRAPSVWLKFNDTKTGNVIMQDVYVPAQGLTEATYYSVLNWNAGTEGGGYAGIQDSPDRGKVFIFSIWDPSNDEAITADFVGDGTQIDTFGGEGTGLKSMNLALGWQPDSWYTLVSKVWDENGHTMFGFWSHDKTNDIWTHLVTMDYPVADVRFTSGTSSFVEDWLGTGNNTRTALFANGHKRLEDGSWIGFDKADFSVVQEEATEAYNENYDALDATAYYRMSTGGTATPGEGINAETSLKRPHTPLTPSGMTTAADIDNVTSTSIAWTLPSSSTPQLKYTIKVNGTVVKSEMDPEKREATFDAITDTDIIELEIENILGKISTLSATVADGQLPVDNELTLHDETVVLEKGVSFTIDSLAKGETQLVELLAPNAASAITFSIKGDNGDADLYVKKGAKATPEYFDCHSAAGGSIDNCILATEYEANYYALITANTDVTELTITATHNGASNGMLDSGDFVVKSVSRTHTAHPIELAFDYDNESVWHTDWDGDVPGYPHQVIIDLGATVDVNRFEYTPRPGASNGTVIKYEIYVSDSETEWGDAVHSGDWVESESPKGEVFTTTPGRYVMFVALEEAEGGPWASAAELKVGIDEDNGTIYEPYGNGQVVKDEPEPEPEPEVPVEIPGYLLDNSTFAYSSTSPAQLSDDDYRPLAHAFDGDLETFWHTDYEDSSVVYPHEVIIDLGYAQNVNRFDYTPRVNAGNGTVVEYEIYVSDSDTEFGEAVASGTWENNDSVKSVGFDAVSSRYVKFVALAEQNGGAFAAAAEINVGIDDTIVEAPAESTLLDSSTFTVNGTTPAQSSNPVSLAFDGDAETFWHTSWDNDAMEYPHGVVIDLGGEQAVNRFDYAPRSGGGNGTVVEYEVYVSNSESDFGTAVSSGTWDNNDEVKTVTFDTTMGRYVKFVALAEQGGQSFASAREINVGVDPSVEVEPITPPDEPAETTMLDSSTFTATGTTPAQPENPLTLAFDGDDETFWHTSWGSDAEEYPHAVIIDLGESYDVTRFDYSPRLNAGNGTVVEYEVYVSDSDSDFGTAVSSGTWANNDEVKTVTFSAVTGRYVKFVALAEQGGNVWAAARELNVGVEL